MSKFINVIIPYIIILAISAMLYRLTENNPDMDYITDIENIKHFRYKETV